MALHGKCNISQSDFDLTEHAGHAVTSTVGGSVFLVSPHHGAPGSHEVTIALLSGPLAESSSEVHVLTLGEKTEDPGIQVFLRPVESPPSKKQLWTLEDVMATKR